MSSRPCFAISKASCKLEAPSSIEYVLPLPAFESNGFPHGESTIFPPLDSKLSRRRRSWRSLAASAWAFCNKARSSCTRCESLELCVAWLCESCDALRWTTTRFARSANCKELMVSFNELKDGEIHTHITVAEDGFCKDSWS